MMLRDGKVAMLLIGKELEKYSVMRTMRIHLIEG
jgi:hypothetical protein